MTVEKKPMGRPPERLPVTINFKLAMGTPAQVEHMSWPKNWPLPMAGDAIQTAEHHGFVTHVTYDLAKNRIIINTR